MATKFLLLAATLCLSRAYVVPTQPINFSSFGYNVADTLSGDFKTQTETRVGNAVAGQYTLIDPDGRRRIVNYTADDNGFNAIIRRIPISTPVPATIVASTPAGVPASNLKTANAITPSIPPTPSVTTPILASVPVFTDGIARSPFSVSAPFLDGQIVSTGRVLSPASVFDAALFQRDVSSTIPTSASLARRTIPTNVASPFANPNVFTIQSANPGQFVAASPTVVSDRTIPILGSVMTSRTGFFSPNTFANVPQNLPLGFW